MFVVVPASVCRRSCGVLFALLLSFASALQAQVPSRPGGGTQPATGELRGVVTDNATGRPLASAGVSVRRAGGENTLAGGALTDAGGAFRVDGLRPGRYTVRVSIIGYEPREQTAAIEPGATAPVDLGTIGLAPGAAVQLEGLTVTAERSAVTVAADRNIYTAESLPAAQSGNASDVLRGVPALEVDADGNVSLRGSPNVVVQVNGRPLALRGDALANFLRQLPGNMVETVEVAPNPSAKYDPEGMGGIVNIVLKKNTDLGRSGSLTLSVGTPERFGGNASFGYGKGPLTLTASYGLNHDLRESDGTLFRENRYLDPVTLLTQTTRGERTFTSHTLNAAADLRVRERDVLSGNLLLSLRDGQATSVDDYLVLDARQTQLEAFNRRSSGDNGGVVGDAAVGWKRSWKPREHELSTELRFNGSRDDDADNLVPGTGGTATSRLATQLQNTTTDSHTESWTGQADYTRPFVAGSKLEAGVKGTLRGITTEYSSDLSFVGLPGIDRVAYDFDYGERIGALYGLLSRGFGKAQLQAGLRLEQTATEFDLATTDEHFENDYLSAFPSAAVAYEIDDLRQVRASYARRIERPDTRLLNPFPRSNDPLNRFVGNPALKPEFTDALEFSFTQSLPWGSLQLAPFYRRTTDVVRRFQETDTAGVSTTTFLNLANADSYGSELTTSLRLGDRLSGLASVSVYRAVTDGANVQSGLQSDATTWSARANATAKLTPSLSLQFFQFYRAPRVTEQGRVGAFARADVSLRQALLNDRASVTLRVSDPFDQSGFSFRTESPLLLQDFDRSFGGRAVYLSFNYSFGEQPRLRRDRPRADQPREQDPDIP